jgi:hypothetical protein
MRNTGEGRVVEHDRDSIPYSTPINFNYENELRALNERNWQQINEIDRIHKDEYGYFKSAPFINHNEEWTRKYNELKNNYDQQKARLDALKEQYQTASVVHENIGAVSAPEAQEGGRKKQRKKTRKKRGGRKKKTRKKRGGQGKKRKRDSTPQVDEANKCGICLKGLRITRRDDAVIHCPACNGIFCRDCLSQWIQFRLPDVAKCPLCNALLPEETYTTLGLTHPNQFNNNNNNADITALNVNQLYSIATPTIATGNQGEREIQNMLMLMLDDIYAQGRARMFERMSAVRFAITRAELVAQHLQGNYNATTNRTPFLQALIADWTALGGHNYYRYLNAYNSMDSIDANVTNDETQLYNQHRQAIQQTTTIQQLLDVVNNTIREYQRNQPTLHITNWHQALLDDRVFLDVFL